MICTHTEGPRHNCAYVDARNARVFAAARFADSMWGKLPPLDGTKGENREEITSQWAASWNQAFHGEMTVRSFGFQDLSGQVSQEFDSYQYLLEVEGRS